MDTKLLIIDLSEIINEVMPLGRLVSKWEAYSETEYRDDINNIHRENLIDPSGKSGSISFKYFDKSENTDTNIVFEFDVYLEDEDTNRTLVKITDIYEL